MRDAIGPGKNLSCSLFGNLSVTSRSQPFAANWAGQTTSAPITSMSPPPAWNWVLSLSKYAPESVGISLYWTLKSLLCLLNLAIRFGRVPLVSVPMEKTKSPEPLLPPPQAALPSNAAPASPAPPSFRNSRLFIPLPADTLAPIVVPSVMLAHPFLRRQNALRLLFASPAATRSILLQEKGKRTGPCVVLAPYTGP